MRRKCLCGAGDYEIDGLDKPILLCHCASCRNIQVTPFTLTAGVLRKHFRILSPFLAATSLLFAVRTGSSAVLGAPPQPATGQPLSEPARPSRIFAPTSFWYQPLPKDAPLHPNSANFVKEFLRQKKAYYGTVNINTTAYACPVYIAGPDAKPVVVTEWDCQHKGWKDPKLAAQWTAVPIPSYAAQADGTDQEMSVFQSSTDSLWEFWEARKVDGQWQACWGGGLQHASKSSGIWDKPYGATATGLPFIGGQINPEELRRGTIDHVMGIALVDTENWDVVSWPAFRSDGFNSTKAPNRIPEGLRFRLDPHVDVDALNLSRTGKIIARAAQKYGFVVWDKAGAISLRADNPKSYTVRGDKDPYPELFEGQPAWSILQNFPWDKLQFLPMDYGKPK